MSDILRIIVNTDKEDNNNPNITSLREAIVKANQSTSNDKVYIDFVRSNPSPNGYTSWLIQPASALPAITHSDVYINHWSPANVTIDGSNLSRKAGDSYSLLTVGLYSELINNASVNRRVHLRHVNLLNNTVTAGNGVKGGGGGLAAGAGISLLHGDVVLENVVFQNLKAIGGNGSRTPNGVGGSVRNICYGANDENPFCGKNEPLATIPSSGHSGGQGGLPTLLGANIPSTGGGGGAKGTSRRHDTSGANGGNGGGGQFGVGGAGGGGGGGGAHVQGTRCLINGFLCTSTSDLDGDGGNGGSGGGGGFGAGGGGGGAAGENSFGKGVRQPGGVGGDGGSPHKSNAGGRGGNSINNGRGVAGGGYGGNGDALGAALSILNPKSNVELYNVDFINSKADSKATAYNAIYVIDPKSRTGTIKSHDTRISSDTTNETEAILENSSLDNQDIYGKLLSSPLPTTLGNLHYAASFVSELADVKIRYPEIEHKVGRSDITSLRIEQPRSTMRQIDIDSSKLESEINEIYKKIIPVESEETIKNRFYSNILDGVISAATGGFASYSSANSLFTASISTPQDLDAATATQKSSYKIGAGLEVLKLGASIFQANSNFKSELAQNQRNIDELAGKLKVDRSVTADPIDVGQARTLVTIKNFTIGEDTIYIDDFWPKNNEDLNYSPIIKPGPLHAGEDTSETFEIHIPNTKTNNNTSTRVALVHVDPQSTQRLKASSQATTAAVYVESLLVANKENKRWEIGTILTDSNRNKQSAINYVGGAAGELVIIERPQNVAVDKLWNTETFDYDDIIYGSSGKDYISTGGGLDQITPGYGDDTVNGGDSIDWVNLENLKEPIIATSSQLTNAGNPLNSIQVANKNNSAGKQIKSELREVESITAFGASSIDLSNLGRPNPIVFINVPGELEGNYAVRSGSGSIINGSQYNDQFIISLMNDDNESGFDSDISLSAYMDQFNTTQQSSGSANDSNDEPTNLDVSSTEVDAQRSTPEAVGTTTALKILAKPSIIIGEGGSDKLTFAVSGSEERGLRITDPMTIGEYKDFRAVVEDGIIFALFKGIDISKVEVINESLKDNIKVLDLYDSSLQPTYTVLDARKTDPASGSDTAETIADQAVINVSVDEQVGDNGFSSSESIEDNETNSVDLEKMMKSFDMQRSIRNRGDIRVLNSLIGNAKNNRLIGNASDNSMSGKKGDDTLIGGQGDDTIKGGSGDDLLYGGTGNNILYGGNGMDVFRLHKDGYQIIKDFNPMLDMIQVGEGLEKNQLEIREDGTLVFGSNVVGKIV